MKKFFAFLALALLAVSGTGYAVTCAYDNVPAATLLVPYWRVSLNGATGAPITGGGTDTLVSVTNVSTPGVIAHVTVWNKYSKAVLDFNVPLTGKDIAFWSMRGVMNGVLNVNSTNNGSAPGTQIIGLPDPCGINTLTNSYQPSVGWGQSQFIRFSHPDAQLIGSGPVTDAQTSISVYLPDAFGAFRVKVWDSLDESGNISTLKTPGANILDTDNPACGLGSGDGIYSGDLSGYLTIDVVNYCTNYFPDQGAFYDKDAIATVGWGPTYTPNVLIGDIYYLDTAATGGNISGDPAIAVEFDSRLPFTGTAAVPLTKTFFGKYVLATTACTTGSELASPGCQYPGVPPAFTFAGDGREPLGDHYGFRYFNDPTSAAQLQTWALVWRSDMYRDFTTSPGFTPNLCHWLTGSASSPTVAKGAAGYGLYDSVHQLTMTVFDNDENPLTAPINGGPSGNQPGQNLYYIFLEASRISISNVEVWADAGTTFKGGWIDLALRGPAYVGTGLLTGFYNQGWVGVQHSGAGAFVSVGYSASNLNNQFQCQPNFFNVLGNTN